MMTLTQAIEKVLLEANAALDTETIAKRINKLKLYERQDKEPIKATVVASRIENNPNNFFWDEEKVLLEEWRDIFEEDPDAILNEIKTFTDLSAVNDENMDLKLKVLMNDKNFRKKDECLSTAPDKKGLVVVRIKNLKGFPKSCTKVIKDRGHNIIEIYAEETSLKNFFESRISIGGDIFRKLGTLMGYTPPKGSLVESESKKEYPFSDKDNLKISNWMNNALIFNWMDFSANFKQHHKDLDASNKPLLANLPQNKETHEFLKELIKECEKVANTKRKK